MTFTIGPGIFLLALTCLLVGLMITVLYHASGTIPTYRGPPKYVIKPHGTKYGLFVIDEDGTEYDHPMLTDTLLGCKMELRSTVKFDQKMLKRKEFKPIYFDADGRKTT